MRRLPAADIFRRGVLACFAALVCFPPPSNLNTWLNFLISFLISFLIGSRLMLPPRIAVANGKDTTRGIVQGRGISRSTMSGMKSIIVILVIVAVSIPVLVFGQASATKYVILSPKSTTHLINDRTYRWWAKKWVDIRSVPPQQDDNIQPKWECNGALVTSGIGFLCRCKVTPTAWRPKHPLTVTP
jgi:hypothetical protein